MGVKIVKGTAGQYEAVKSSSQQLSQSRTVASRASQAVSSGGDAVVSLVRGGRSESSERLTLQKAEKVAKGLKEDILSRADEALDAVGSDFSLSAVRDAFGV
ncbi:hypothetical protein MRY87_00310 [bacterium]|nr:hypothetical protein [bacterium]